MAITKADKAFLKSLPIQGYLDFQGIPYVQDGHNQLRLVDHNSLVVRTDRNQFVWNSTGAKGDLVNFIHFYELGKSDGDKMSEAMARRFAYGRYVKDEKVDMSKFSTNSQPRAKFDYDKVFRTDDTSVAQAYLTQKRGLDANFVQNLLAKGDIAQGTKYKLDGEFQESPVIFPWRDVTGHVVGADKQGTQIDFDKFEKRGTHKQIIAGSDTRTGFNIKFGKGNETLALFESPIDLLSYAQQNHEALLKANATLLSVSGTDAKRGRVYLEDAITQANSHVNKIIVGFDNDLAGFKAADYFNRFSLKNPNTNQPITVERHVPSVGKDWNEQLKKGVAEKTIMTLDENESRLASLEAFKDSAVAQQTESDDKQADSALDSQVTPSTLAPKEPKAAPDQKMTKAQRARQNRERNMSLVKEAMAGAKKYQTDPQELKKLLDFTAQGLNYSARNSMLIHLQRPDASLVKGYKQWEALGIQVEKGQKAIRIFSAPHNVKTIVDTNGEKIRWQEATPEQINLANAGQLETISRQYYNTETVFDIRQTNADLAQLPQLLPNRSIDLATDQSPIHIDNAFKALEKYAKGQNIKLPTPTPASDQALSQRKVTWQGNAKGAFIQSRKNPEDRQILLRSDLTPTDRVHVLAHELAHADLHSLQKQNNWPTAIKETQAELTSYVISKNLGIDPGEASIRYISQWSKNLSELPAEQTGKIVSQALRSSTKMTMYLGDQLENGELRQVKTRYPEKKQTQTQVQNKQYQPVTAKQGKGRA